MFKVKSSCTSGLLVYWPHLLHISDHFAYSQVNNGFKCSSQNWIGAGSLFFTDRQVKLRTPDRFVRPLSVYSMGDESSDEMKLSPTRKKTDIWVLFYFFLRHAEKRVYFFPKSVVFQPQNNQDFKKSPTRKSHEGFFFSFFPLTRHKNLSLNRWQCHN